MDRFDYAVIGAGPGGYVSAIRAAQLGLKTVLIEKDTRLGGCCLNVGCIPSKSLLESSEWYAALSKKIGDHGLSISGLKLDLTAMMARKHKIVETLTDGIDMLMKRNKITVIRGRGRLVGQNRIAIDRVSDSIEILADAITLALGSAPVELPFMVFDTERIVTSTEALAFDRVPKHLIVVGGGGIGLELGSVWRRLGAKVSVVEMLPQIAPFADRQMAVMLGRYLKSQGLEIYLKSTVTGAEVKGDKVFLSFKDTNGETHILEGDKVLVSVGRKPLTTGAGLETTGVLIDRDGSIPVDERFQTNVKGIYAIGDLIHGPMLAHKASEEGIAVAEIIAGMDGHVNYAAIPNVIYTSPELAAVGMSEEEARAQNIEYRTGKFFFKGNGRALSLGETDGLVKILADAETGKLLGVHILGPRASDLIAEAVTAIELGARAEDLAGMVHAHPTLSEAVKEAALAVDKRSIHG